MVIVKFSENVGSFFHLITLHQCWLTQWTKSIQTWFDSFQKNSRPSRQNLSNKKYFSEPLWTVGTKFLVPINVYGIFLPKWCFQRRLWTEKNSSFLRKLFPPRSFLVMDLRGKNNLHTLYPPINVKVWSYDLSSSRRMFIEFNFYMFLVGASQRVGSSFPLNEHRQSKRRTNKIDETIS